MSTKVSPAALRRANDMLRAAYVSGSFDTGLRSRSIPQLLTVAQSMLQAFPGLRATWTAGKLRAVRA